ncbi:MAG TPA: histidine kinase, partial [Bacteroidia bacterium]|nr:histidine kinase [Bacteroidia bacterium]
MNGRHSSFPKLSPGKYSFDVRSRNNEGVISTTAAPFSFTIRPPFWRTWWFYSLSALLVTLTIYVLVRRRVKSIRQKSLMKQQIIESELKALRSQINPHFLFNSLNSIQAF